MLYGRETIVLEYVKGLLNSKELKEQCLKIGMKIIQVNYVVIDWELEKEQRKFRDKSKKGIGNHDMTISAFGWKPKE